ncbi:hypothetical protein HY256_09030 [Candidatus Sumerlaeota bacterium]|nr:hypothetical protein [Candidatus Sumerlaeota bacterium]
MASRREFLRLGGAAMFFAHRAAWAYTPSTNSERKLIVDPETGVNIWQVTSFPTVNQNLYFHSRCWTADGKTFLFQSLQTNSRDSAYDLFRVNVDGTDLQRLTNKQSYGNFALHPSKPLGYFTAGNDIFTINIETKEIAKVGTVAEKGSVGSSIGSMTNDGQLFCFDWTAPDSTRGFGLFNTETREAKITPLGVKGKFTHLQIEPGEGKLVQFVGDGKKSGDIVVYVADTAGKIEPLPFTEANGHNAWLGATGRVYTDTLGEQRDILAVKPGSKEIGIIAKAPPRFWHTGVSPEGDWMVSDTNSPDDGLFLICVKTGKHTRLCRAGSSEGHSQYTHPHPSVSPGAGHVVFNSDRTGIPHVYCAEIPEAMKKSLLV